MSDLSFSGSEGGFGFNKRGGDLNDDDDFEASYGSCSFDESIEELSAGSGDFVIPGKASPPPLQASSPAPNDNGAGEGDEDTFESSWGSSQRGHGGDGGSEPPAEQSPDRDELVMKKLAEFESKRQLQLSAEKDKGEAARTRRAEAAAADKETEAKEAGETGDWQGAVRGYEAALALLPEPVSEEEEDSVRARVQASLAHAQAQLEAMTAPTSVSDLPPLPGMQKLGAGSPVQEDQEAGVGSPLSISSSVAVGSLSGSVDLAESVEAAKDPQETVPAGGKEEASEVEEVSEVVSEVEEVVEMDELAEMDDTGSFELSGGEDDVAGLLGLDAPSPKAKPVAGGGGLGSLPPLPGMQATAPGGLGALPPLPGMKALAPTPAADGDDGDQEQPVSAAQVAREARLAVEAAEADEAKLEGAVETWAEATDTDLHPRTADSRGLHEDVGAEDDEEGVSDGEKLGQAVKTWAAATSTDLHTAGAGDCSEGASSDEADEVAVEPAASATELSIHTSVMEGDLSDQEGSIELSEAVEAAALSSSEH
eukprot:COSAG01_NODE_11720_length_1872_cov_13.580923_2_plen_537_part_01